MTYQQQLQSEEWKAKRLEILERIGIPLSEQTSEVYAYMVGYITKQVYKNLNQ